MSDDDIFLPLSKTLFTHKSDFPPELLPIINTELRQTLTLRSLVHLCTACKQKPTAPMLAFALQNSIPSLTRLPMDNPNPGFYINVATTFFCDKKFATIKRRRWLYRVIHHFEGLDAFFPPDVNLYAPLDEYRPSAMDYYVHHQITHIGKCFLSTQEGRRLSREMMLEWRAHYEGYGPEYHDFIDRVVRILDYGFVLLAEYEFIIAGVDSGVVG